MDTATQQRAEMTAAINAAAADRERLEAEHGQVWDTHQLTAEFIVEGFAAPCIVCRRKSTDERGSMFFQHDPRFYWGFKKES